MGNNKLYIKNMVCDRCKMAVQSELNAVGIKYNQITLGEVTVTDLPSDAQVKQFQTRIEKLGFELIEDKTARTISAIKNAVIEYVHGKTGKQPLKFSAFATEKLKKDYNYLSNLFSAFEGKTIEQFIILQKIERAKEFLVYDELTLSEIAYALGYSSVQHLSTQFKKVTGLTPSHFKQIGEKRRKSLDQI